MNNYPPTDQSTPRTHSTKSEFAWLDELPQVENALRIFWHTHGALFRESTPHSASVNVTNLIDIIQVRTVGIMGLSVIAKAKYAQLTLGRTTTSDTVIEARIVRPLLSQIADFLEELQTRRDPLLSDDDDIRKALTGLLSDPAITSFRFNIATFRARTHFTRTMNLPKTP